MFKLFSFAYWSERRRARAREDYSVKREIKALKMEQAQIIKKARKQLQSEMNINKKDIRIKNMKK